MLDQLRKAGGLAVLVGGLLNADAQQSPFISSYKSVSAGQLEMIVNNLTPSHTYAVLSSSNVVCQDIFNNTPTVEGTFTPTSSGVGVFLNKDLSRKFSYLIDLNTYAGPNPNIVSPTNGQMVSGDFSVQLSGRAPLLPFNSQIYLVNNNNGATFLVGNLTNSPAVANISSAMYASGPATIYVVSTTKQGVPTGDEYGDQQFYQTVKSVPVFVTNNVEAVNFQEVTSGDASIPVISHGNLTNANYNLTVSDLNGSILSTQTGQFQNGSATLNWNQTSNGVPINIVGNSYAYNLSVQASASSTNGVNPLIQSEERISSGTPGQAFTFFRTFAGSPVLGYRFLTTEQAPSSYDWQPVASGFGVVGDDTYNSVLLNLNQNREPLNYWNGKGLRTIMQSSQQSDLNYITNNLASPSVGGWIWFGHGSPSNLANGVDHFITASILCRDIGNFRHNTQSIQSYVDPKTGVRHFGMKYGLVCPLLETWLFGCATALNGDWAAATGTAPIDYTTKPSLFPTTFFGFNSLMTNDDASHAFSSLLPDDWVGGPYGFGGYGTASQAVNDGLSAYPEMLNYTPAAYGNPNCVFNSRY